MSRGTPTRRRIASLFLLTLASSSHEARSEDPPAPALVLNEIMASNRTVLADEDGRTSDWIEIHNRGSVPADLAGFTISDDAAVPGKWRFPPLTVPPGGHLLVWASGKDRWTMPARTLRKLGPLPFERALIRPGERWRYLLAEPGGRGPPASWADPSFDDSGFAEGRSGFGYADGDDATVLPEGTTAVFIRRRFLVEDPARIVQLVLRIDYDDGFVAYLNGACVARANSPVPDPDFDSIATAKHEPGRAECFDLTPHAGRLVRGENVLAIAGLNDSPSSDMSLIPELGTFPSILHASFELASGGGEIVLAGPGGKPVDRVRYPPQVADRSWGRTPDAGAAWAFFLTPTTGAANRSRPFADPPSAEIALSPAPGFHPGPIEVEVKVESRGEGIVVRSTLDGSAPTRSSRIVSGPIPIDSSAVVRIAAFIGDERASPIVSASYFLEPPPHLPVISISMARRDFEETHLAENAHGLASEKPAHVEVFSPGGARTAATGVGFRLHGGYGRRGDLSTKKSYRLYFRPLHGEPEIEVPWIPGLAGKPLDRLVLRAGFNDRLGAYHPGACFVRDQVIRDLHRDMGAAASAGAWCVLVVNGEWKGIYNAVERIDEDFLRRHVGAGDWDMVKTGQEVVCGTRDAWDDLKRLVARRGLSPDERHHEIGRAVDLESFTAYVILNLWAQNEDWPQNNWYAARRRDPGGKWIFLSWDAEWGLGLTPQGYTSDSFRATFDRQERVIPIRDLLAALLESAEYRAYLRKETERHLAGALGADNVRRHVDRNAAAIRPLIARELQANAGGFPPEIWERSVETVRAFAGRRGPYFRRLVERWLAGPPAALVPPAPR
jgi:hypothetical protein